MGVRRMFFAASAGAFLLPIAACAPAPSTTVATTKVEIPAKQPKRLFVVQLIGQELGRDTRSFETKFAGIIGGCGVVADFFTRPAQAAPSLSLDDSSYKTQSTVLNGRIAAFQPDSILSLAETPVANGAQSGDAPAVTYMLELLDAATRKPLWKGQVVLRPRNAGPSDAGEALANGVIGRMKADGLLTGCSPAGT